MKMKFLIFSILLCIILHAGRCEEDAFKNDANKVISLISAAISKDAEIVDSSNDEETSLNTTVAADSTDVGARRTVPSDRKIFYISDEIPRCSETDVNLNDCIKNAYEHMLPLIKDGRPELNIPAVDPFLLNQTSFHYAQGPISARIIMRNGSVHGLLNTKIKDLKFKLTGNNRYTYHAKMFVPRLKVVGNYRAVGTFNRAKILPNGTFSLTINKIDMDVIADGDIYKNDQHLFMHLEHFDVKPTIGDYKLNATGIFPDPNLSSLVLNIANQYWRQIYSIMLPETKRYWAPLLQNIINQVMEAMPYDLVVTDISDATKGAANKS